MDNNEIEDLEKIPTEGDAKVPEQSVQTPDNEVKENIEQKEEGKEEPKVNEEKPEGSEKPKGRRGRKASKGQVEEGASSYIDIALLTPVAGSVFPSEEETIMTVKDEVYGGAHTYVIKNCLGFNEGKTQYDDSQSILHFVQKAEDGTITPGLQSEQVILALIDRHMKLNAKYPDPRHNRMMAGLRGFLQACKERVEERIERGVMGELKK